MFIDSALFFQVLCVHLLQLDMLADQL